MTVKTTLTMIAAAMLALSLGGCSKEDVEQAYVRMGHLGMTVDNPDYFAAQVLNQVLGGSASARLFSTAPVKRRPTTS